MSRPRPRTCPARRPPGRERPAPRRSSRGTDRPRGPRASGGAGRGGVAGAAGRRRSPRHPACPSGRLGRGGRRGDVGMVGAAGRRPGDPRRHDVQHPDVERRRRRRRVAVPPGRGGRDHRSGRAAHPRHSGGSRRADRLLGPHAARLPVDRRRPRLERRRRAQRVHANLLPTPRAEPHRVGQLLAHRHPGRPAAVPAPGTAASVPPAAGAHRHLGPVLPPGERPRDLRVQHPPDAASGAPPVPVRPSDCRPRRRAAAGQRRRRHRRLQRERRRHRDLAHRDRTGLAGCVVRRGGTTGPAVHQQRLRTPASPRRGLAHRLDSGRRPAHRAHCADRGTRRRRTISLRPLSCRRPP